MNDERPYKEIIEAADAVINEVKQDELAAHFGIVVCLLYTLAIFLLFESDDAHGNGMVAIK
jgi:hypothetical protein